MFQLMKLLKIDPIVWQIYAIIVAFLLSTSLKNNFKFIITNSIILGLYYLLNILFECFTYPCEYKITNRNEKYFTQFSRNRKFKIIYDDFTDKKSIKTIKIDSIEVNIINIENDKMEQVLYLIYLFGFTLKNFVYKYELLDIENKTNTNYQPQFFNQW